MTKMLSPVPDKTDASCMSTLNAETEQDSDIETVTKKDDYLDTWRGWIVVVASSTSLFVYMGVIYSWGVMQAELASTSSMSLLSLTFVGSLATSFMCSAAIFVGKFIRRYGYCKAAMTGATLLGLGEFLSSWATDHLGILFLTHGLIFGIGGGFTILSSSTAPFKWFQKHAGLATGVVFAGGSLGAAVLSVTTNELIRHIGVQWTFRVLGFILWAICLPAACVMKQPPNLEAPVPEIQWYRFKNKEFLVLFFGSSLACFPLYIPPYFIPIFAKAVSSSSNAPIISLTVWNLASTAGRIIAGYTADSFLGPMNSLVAATFLCAISALAIWPFASTMGLLIFFTVINGLGCGAFFSLFSTVVGAVFGRQNTIGVLPVMWTGWFFGFFLGTPIASFIYTKAGNSSTIDSYRPAAYYAGAASAVGMVVIIWARQMRANRLFQKM